MSNHHARRIAHLDMDAFFASVELLSYPELRDLPVVVGGRNIAKPHRDTSGNLVTMRLRDYSGRGVVTTSTYAARSLGVYSGMGLMKSARLAPNAILLPANFAAYREYSQRFKSAVRSIAPTIEDRGIDEIYIDLSEFDESSIDLGEMLKSAVFAATGLTCSIGITPNKLLSKIASDLDKPNGITILGLEDIPSRIWPLSVNKINGIGPKLNEKLNSLGILTVKQLADIPLEDLLCQFGSNTGLWLHESARGIDDRPVETYREPKSFSRETTFERDLTVQQDRDTLGNHFTHLCERVAEDLCRKGYAGRTIGIKVRFADFKTVTRDLTLPMATADAKTIRQAATECLKRISLTKPIRLLGVRVSSTKPKEDIKPMPTQSTLQF